MHSCKIPDIWEKHYDTPLLANGQVPRTLYSVRDVRGRVRGPKCFTQPRAYFLVCLPVLEHVIAVRPIASKMRGPTYLSLAGSTTIPCVLALAASIQRSPLIPAHQSTFWETVQDLHECRFVCFGGFVTILALHDFDAQRDTISRVYFINWGRGCHPHLESTAGTTRML